jgi:hypothetical protein
MIKKFIFTAVLLLLCSSCVSRTTIKEPGLKDDTAGKGIRETKLVWFWDKDF